MSGPTMEVDPLAQKRDITGKTPLCAIYGPQSRLQVSALQGRIDQQDQRRAVPGSPLEDMARQRLG
ncbi:hypothetical protein AB9K41_04720, partial [Cribrihabitans sp. XS_ASV171]